MKLLTIAILVLLMSTTVEARNRWFGRRYRAPSCSNGNCQPQIQPPPPVAKAEPLTEPKEIDTGALAQANVMRARRGLRPFLHAPRLQPYANAQAMRQAQRGWMGHYGSRMGPGAYGEGVGGRSPSFQTCYLYSNYTHAAAASVNGFHCLQVTTGPPPPPRVAAAPKGKDEL